jgi:hypothetical protein
MGLINKSYLLTVNQRVQGFEVLVRPPIKSKASTGQTAAQVSRGNPWGNSSTRDGSPRRHSAKSIVRPSRLIGMENLSARLSRKLIALGHHSRAQIRIRNSPRLMRARTWKNKLGAAVHSNGKGRGF